MDDKSNITKSPNIIDLFCGCGGLSYGFEKAGYNVLLGIDQDVKALQTFKYNHINSETICEDITQISYNEIKKIIGDVDIDLIVGGPPCQGMSLAGFRDYNDPRNKLYLSYIGLVKEIRPRAFLIENVPGLVSLYKGKIIKSILKEFNDLGYTVNYKVLNSADFGVPQTRKRVIIVGLQGQEMFQFPTSLDTSISCEMALSDLPPLVDEIGSETSDYYMPVQNEYQKLMREDSDKVYNHIAAKHSDRVKKIIALVPDGGNYKDLPEEYKYTRNYNVAWTRFCSTKPAPTIDTGHRHHFHYKYNRVPTVRECARLQSFPDNFIFFGNKTQQFRQVGNAVPPLLAKAVANKIKKYLKR